MKADINKSVGFSQEIDCSDQIVLEFVVSVLYLSLLLVEEAFLVFELVDQVQMGLGVRDEHLEVFKTKVRVVALLQVFQELKVLGHQVVKH